MEYAYKDYQVQVDQIGKSEWSAWLRQFDDATLYQTWSYGAVRWGGKNLSHIVLKQDNDVVAMAQARLLRIPFLGAGITYIGWGPVWRRRGRDADVSHLNNIIAVLREEYVLRRRLFLRVFPNEIGDHSDLITAAFESEGFRWKPRPDRTIVIDLSASIEDLRRDLRRQWLQNLKKAEENKLELVEGKTEELYQTALAIYEEMHRRKKFVEFMNTDAFVPMQRDLPDDLKMKILVAYHEGKAVAAVTWAEIGQTGLALVSATSSLALKTYAAYLLWWKMIQLMKDHGCRYCDTGGINPDLNPGGYQFKSGLAKKQGKEVAFIGQFDSCQNGKSRLFVEWGEAIRSFHRRTQRKLKRQ